jgi:outer membrane receptor for ferrienterochelin and colicins
MGGSGGIRERHLRPGKRTAVGRLAKRLRTSDGLATTREWCVVMQVSRGFRDPLLSDRYFRGPSGRGFITGNPDLQPETSLQLDVATRYTTARSQVGVYLYRYRIDNLIERYQTQTDDFVFRNRGAALLRGFEVETRSELGRGYSIEVGAQVARGHTIDDAVALDDISPVTAFLVGRKQVNDGIYALARLAWSAADNHPGPSEVLAPSATLLDAGTGFQLVPQLQLRLLFRNLLNEHYYASPDARWVAAPGRSFALSASALF